ncbi:ABC transporter permease [Grimontia hollisae]|uniref:Probable D,D-dipeptide transport system permease protein ddpC n=2 Tax=Grimontia hollisae TaxID=673 RepID=A0A377HQI2_GRIHO|nr:ABC transporter permease [Grimontia hollisae]AMG31031.1 ABC transporter permease [Grimontia hollisae]EEY72845.1 putative peptide ABC transporter permeaseprotein [Grimontia hollisae CIP 101886]MDF2186452.1 ABC transporter permease [Grimontia hollisae]STO46851.1 Probable D,D-dipeptide transport system permease protein ddpC [Grimontia hollisae]STO58419.1 Probable D,D-dipeptide transport system permease protein ddpC [Grimontia hollisae]
MNGIFSIIRGNPKALVGVSLIFMFIIAAVFAPFLSKYDPQKRTGNPHEYPAAVVKIAQANPDGWVAENLADNPRRLRISKDAEHVMGTTRLGRDIWSQVVHGARTSLFVGFTAGIFVCVVATIMGISAGYFGGRVDNVLSGAMNVMLVMPQLPIVMVVAAFVGQAGPLTIALVIALTSWAWGARVIRSQTLAIREKEFVKAAEVLGESRPRILFVEILPNLIPLVGASFIGSVMYAILTESVLSFIGMGSPNAVSWGSMLYNVRTSSAMQLGIWWEVLAPCLALSLLSFALALVNFAVDEIANPQLRAQKGLKRWKKVQQEEKKAREQADVAPQTTVLSGEK